MKKKPEKQYEEKNFVGSQNEGKKLFFCSNLGFKVLNQA